MNKVVFAQSLSKVLDFTAMLKQLSAQNLVSLMASELPLDGKIGLIVDEAIRRLSSDNEVEIMSFVEDKFGPKTLEKIGIKLGGEVGEVLEAITKLEEGRLTVDDLEDEMGDVLIVLSQLAAKRGTTLLDLREKRFKKIKARNK